jgi:hypothetical protein
MNEHLYGDGNRIYSVEAMETLNPAVNSAPSGYQGQTSNPPPDSVMARLREMTASVNPQSEIQTNLTEGNGGNEEEETSAVGAQW